MTETIRAEKTSPVLHLSILFVALLFGSPSKSASAEIQSESESRTVREHTGVNSACSHLLDRV